MAGIENIERYDGFLISLSGLSIVFISLILISLYIALLPRILELVHRLLPEDDHPDAATTSAPAATSPSGEESLRQAAAAATAFHHAVEGGR